MKRVLILGGTSEARRFAEQMATRNELVPTYSLAGLTDARGIAGVHMRRGGFGGAQGLRKWLSAENIDAIVDGSHPFAARISENAHQAAEELGLPYARLERAAWGSREGDRWVIVADLASAAETPRPGDRVFLALGRSGSVAFTTRCDLWKAARVAEKGALLVGVDHLEVGAPGSADAEAELFARLRINRLVARNSGGEAGYGKIEAARRLGLTVVMIDRPKKRGRAFSNMDAVFEWL